MSAGAAAGEEAAGLRRRLTGLLAARLGIALLAFALALALVGAGHEGAELAERGLYGTLALAFGVTALYALALRFVTRLARFGALQLGTDVAIVTSLVVFSGAADSVFSFLYLPITVMGAVLFGRRGAYGSAGLASACYGGVLVAASAGGLAATARPAPEVALAVWGVHAAALLLVALLASALARELRVAGERLDARTHDLAELRWLHERTVESLTSGLLTLGPDDRVTSFNPEAERITGCSAAQVHGRLLDEVLPGASAILREGGAGPGGRRGRRRLGFADARGEGRHLGLAGSVLRDADGTPSGHVLIFQDVTDVVAMEQGLRRSERLAAVGQLAADIAHEIRNPLAAISGCVEMLRDGRSGPVDAEARRLMGIVIREIERLDDLITDFLQYARPAPPKPESVELLSVVGEVAEMCRHGFPPEIELEVAVPAGLCVQADATQLRQALWNLVANARQAMPAGGRLRVAARAQVAPQGGAGTDRRGGMEGSPAVEICVSDTGTGIAPEIVERVFDPFFTTKAGGTGLGLATVHRIVEGHGGSIQVETRVGKGTTFRMRFPGGEEAA